MFRNWLCAIAYEVIDVKCQWCPPQGWIQDLKQVGCTRCVHILICGQKFSVPHSLDFGHFGRDVTQLA